MPVPSPTGDAAVPAHGSTARVVLLGPLLGGGGLQSLATALAADAARIRSLAADLAAVAAGTGWRSTAADACRARIAGVGVDLLAAARRLDAAADAVARHARGATHRAESALQALCDAVLAAGPSR